MKIEKDILKAQEYAINFLPRTAEYEEHTKNYSKLTSKLKMTLKKRRRRNTLSADL